MRQHLHIARSLTGRIAAAVVAIVTVTGCGRASIRPVEAGYPSDLINTPVCVEDFDDGLECSALGWVESGLYRPIR